MNINGHTRFLAHLGHPTHSFKAPMIYNPYFEDANINAVVVPMDCQAQHLATMLQALKTQDNFLGALITMPHKVSVMQLLDQASPAALIAGACNAVRWHQGRWVGDLFDGEGFVRGLQRRGFGFAGKQALVLGSGGVGSAIAAALAAAGMGRLQLFDLNADSAQSLMRRLQQHYPNVSVAVGDNNPAGFDLVVNATPLGMNKHDVLPLDVNQLSASTWVGEVVMQQAHTPLVQAALARGCEVQVGVDMLFEQIPAYLEFFGLPSTDALNLRRLARIAY